jgi:2-keto-3-deoxy-6-phosphogluconate aldolase
MVARIATGEIEDKVTDDGKNAAAVALGRMGGKARAAGMSKKKRTEIAKKAAKARWNRQN